tara:strand:+ start:26275 stop:27498 length:1224 start_codon:yes stop_codon:yes gene_type:complete
MLLVTTATIAQNIESETVKFDFERLPLQPIAGLKGYSFTVETPYKENNDALISEAKAKFDADVANYPNTVIESEQKHEQALAQYEEDVVKAREDYKIQAEEYDKLSAVEKIALKAKAPVLRTPSKPNYYKPPFPVYTEPNTSNIITFDPAVLAGSYLKLAGYDKATEGKVMVGKVILNDFQADSPISRFTVKKVYNSTSKTYVEQKTYYYITKYSRPTYLKLQVGNEILFEGMLEVSLVQDSSRTEKQPNMMNLEKESVRQSLALANEYINSNHGYSQINRTIEVDYVKNKKGDYDDLESAKDMALAAYKYFDGGKNREELIKAVAIWEKTLEQSDLESNKARIDKKVTASILFNLINAYLLIENPADADKHLVALKKINAPYRIELMIPKFESEVRDLRARLDAKI